MIPRLTLQEAQGSIDSDSHGFVVLSPIYHRLIGPVAEPHVGPDGSRTLTAVQETHHQRDDGADGLHVLPEHRELYLREPHTKAVCTTYTIRSSDRKREKNFFIRGTAKSKAAQTLIHHRDQFICLSSTSGRWLSKQVRNFSAILFSSILRNCISLVLWGFGS